jgi:hypothetical protein
LITAVLEAVKILREHPNAKLINQKEEKIGSPSKKDEQPDEPIHDQSV